MKLSIVLATYDDEVYLPTSIEAILNQSFKDFELIIVNDASPDNSDSIIKGYALSDSRIVYLKNEKNLGAVKSYNRGCKAAKGDYMYHASSDDKVLPNCFEEMMYYLSKHPEIPVCTSDNGYFDDENETILKVNKLIPSTLDAKAFSATETIELFKTTRFLVSGYSSIFKRSEGEKRGYLSESLGYTCDFVLYNSIALTKGVIYIPKVLTAMRQFPENRGSLQKRKEAIQCTDNWVSYVKNKKDLWDIFYRSTLLARTVPSKLFTVFLKPKHWNILLPLSWMKFKLLIKKKFRRLTTTWIIVK